MIVNLKEDNRNNIKKYLSDYDDKDGILKLLKLSSFGRLRKSILKPQENILDNLKEAYIFGSQRLGEKIYNCLVKNGIDVIAFIDNDVNRQGNYFCGKKIIPVYKIKKSSTIIIASLNYLYEISKQLEDLGFKNYINCPVLSLYNKRKFPPEPSFNKMLEDLFFNRFKYISLYFNLSDGKSRKVLNELIKFRLSFDYKLLNCPRDRLSNEYFDKGIVSLKKHEVFVDAGAYKGETTLRFIKKIKKRYKKIYLFEPDRRLLLMAKGKLKKYKGIKYIPQGLFSRDAVFRFFSGRRPDNCINKNGNAKIPVVAVDRFINEKITFIKLDIEGVEKEAMAGAKNHIKNESPKLAVAAYHRPSDIWEIPEVIFSINPNYKIYLRNYSTNLFEKIIYGVI